MGLNFFFISYNFCIFAFYFVIMIFFKMKKLLSILVLATLCFSAVAQKTAKHYSMDVHGLSPEAAMALLDLRMGKTLDAERYGVVTSEGQRCLSAFVLPAAGVYTLCVGNAPARKIVVVY